jgi:hypothetical protein
MFETTNQIKLIKMGHTVDGRNPAPVGKWFIPLQSHEIYRVS